MFLENSQGEPWSPKPENSPTPRENRGVVWHALAVDMVGCVLFFFSRNACLPAVVRLLGLFWR